MAADRAMALLAHEGQWARCAHDGTILLPDGGIGLDWSALPAPSPWNAAQAACQPRDEPAAPARPSGLTHDRWCRVWQTRPEKGSVGVTAGPDSPFGDWQDALKDPTGIAVDAVDRLYVAESAGRAVVIADLWSGRLLGRVALDGCPVDVVALAAPDGLGVLALLRSPRGVVRIEGRPGCCPIPEALRRPCAHRGLKPSRITVLSGRPVVLWCGDSTAVVADLAGVELLEEPRATDIEGTAEGLLVVALGPGDAIRRFREREEVLVEDKPLAAAGYDGGAVTIDPNGRVVYSTETGSRTTQGPLARHVRRGSVTTYRLDSGDHRTRWGRVFIDACLPRGTDLKVRALTTDEDAVDYAIPPAPPGRGIHVAPDADQMPPLPPKGSMDEAPLVPVIPRRDAAVIGAVDPIVKGAEWTTYETGVDAPPGRYVWLQLQLTGTERTSPRVRAVRIERPGHALLSALPRIFSSVDEQADFLHGYLTPAEGLLHDLDTAAAERRLLVDPLTAPDEFLPWLATFAGIVLDRRWSEDARRALLAEIFPLYARRGTVAALERMLYLYLGRKARVVEQWRLRGLGGAFLGFEPEGRLDSPSVAGTVRKAGMLGHFTVGGQRPDSSSYSPLAHRFTVLVPGCLTWEQREVVDDLISTQKPSHTLGDVCELGGGMPVGRMRVGLTAYVAPPRGRGTGVLGRARIGHDGVVGTPASAPSVARSRFEGVRVG